MKEMTTCGGIFRKFFKQGLCGLALIFFLATTSPNGFAQIYINGEAVKIWYHHVHTPMEEHVCIDHCQVCINVADAKCFDTGEYAPSWMLLPGAFINNSRSNGTAETAEVYAYYHPVKEYYSDATLDNYGTIGAASVSGMEFWDSSYGRYRYVSGALINRGSIGTAHVYTYGNIGNANDCSIGTVHLYGGAANNSGTINEVYAHDSSQVSNTANIGAMFVGGNAYISNGRNGSIGTLYCEDKGQVTNFVATINDAIVKGGIIYNAGNISTLLMTGGMVDNRVTHTSSTGYGIGTITNAIINGGELRSHNNGYASQLTIIRNLTINDGTVSCGDVIIDNATQNGGVINNGGRIDKMTYVDGTYNGMGRGTIGTLILAGNPVNNPGNWGIIEKLAFDNGGNGIITFTASANTMAAAVEMAFEGILPMNANTPTISFSSNINAQNIDFTHGNIALDLTGLTGFSEADILSSLFVGGFEVASLFGTANVTGLEGLNSFQLTFETGAFYVFNDGVFASGWSFADGVITYEVPEPATLLMLGLGLAGLPIVSRLRKR